ncbi:ATP-binding protein [Streptomyces sp. AJS327]|uniref:ATP-binding protein n=1 Tax=Streptomyces sp. AJS327 TaxID=2545265 RepID=UPI0027E4ADA1|nr:ATP-binding protein [Streptomyces sp. AJS327]
MANLRSAYATVAEGVTAAARRRAGEGTRPPVPRPPPRMGRVRDLRGTAPGPAGTAAPEVRPDPGHRTLRLPEGARLVISGLPGSGKSTLIRRTVPDTLPGPTRPTGGAAGTSGAGAGSPGASAEVRRIDSQDTRERWERALPDALRWLPYAVYRPLVRIAHYLRLYAALASGAGVVVHDCGTQGWVRRWLAWDSRRRGRTLHLLLLDVPPEVALRGQSERGRGVSGYAFLRHRRAVRRLITEAESGVLPRGCASVVLLDRQSAARLDRIDLGQRSGAARLPAPR